MDVWKKAEKDIIFHKNKINIIENCVDRYAKQNPKKLAFVFENEKGKIKKYSYKKLQNEVNKFANLLNKLRIKKKSRIFIFLPKIPELYIGFLGIIKQGSIVIPLFESFQTQGLELRLKRGNAEVIITNKKLLKRLKHKIKGMKTIIVDSGKYKTLIKKSSENFKAVLKNKKETALMLFTSSTAGTPVAGIELSHYGIVQQHFTGKSILNLKKNDRYWCTAHPGWVTGGIYGIITPLSIGCTSYIYTPHFSARKWINFLKKHKISIVYTAPTALRLLKYNIKKSDLKYIKNIFSVGESLTKTTFDFYKKLGVEINDTYWQTETGAIVIANSPFLNKKPGSMGKAIPGIQAKIEKGEIILKKGWPAMMTGIYRHQKMYKNYFKNNWFYTKDLAEKDRQGYFFFKGRHDDIIKTSGERVSPIEIESELMRHPAVKETVIIGIPNKIKGSIIKAFIVLNSNFKPSKKLKQELTMFVKKNYAGHSYPKQIQFIHKMPKTNSGKIIRSKLKNYRI